MANEVVVSLPTIRLTISGEGAVPSVAIALPQFVVEATGSSGFIAAPELEWPMFELAIAGSTSLSGRFDYELPQFEVAVTGATGVVGSVAVECPTLQIAASLPDAAFLALPTPVFAAEGHVGVVGGVSVIFPRPTFAASGEVPFTATVDAALPRFAVEVAGTTGAVATVAITLRQLALAAEGITGTLGTVDIELPILDLEIDGYQPIIGYAVLTLPMMRLQITGRAAAQDAAATVVMNTETQALTTYSNFPFNSFARFNGVVLGACDDGLFALTGDTDDGVLIQAAARVGTSDFGTPRYKRIEEVVVGYRASGDLVLRVYTDETTVRDYRLAVTGRPGLHGQTAKLGRGIAARYWQFEVRNQAGADFELNMIELEPVILPRKFGGRHA